MVVAAFYQEKALIGAFSVIVKTDCETDGALHSTTAGTVQVFAILWVWHCLLILAGLNRIVTRSIQLLSHRVRYFLMKMMMHRWGTVG